MLAVDENVWDSSLAGLRCEGVLNVAAVGNLVELDGMERDALALESLLGGDAERAVALAVHHDLVGGDLRVDLLDEVLGHLDVK